MASAKKSLYVDSLSVQDIYSRGPNNTTLPQDQILLTNGQGGTVWQPVASLLGGGAFTTITTTPSTITARSSAPYISILDGPNAGLTVDPTAPNTLHLYAVAFNKLQLSGNYQGSSTISAYDNPTNTYKSTLSFVAGNNISFLGDSSGNTLTINAVPASNATFSTLTNLLNNMSTLNSSIASDISNFNSPYSAQPFIQYGSTILGSNGQTTINFSGLSPPGKTYKSVNYTVQLTYQYSISPSTIKPLSCLINSSNSFTAYGDINRVIYWTTYGNIF